MLFEAVFSLETLDPTGSVDQSLLTGIKRMAPRANFDMNLRQRRTRFKGVATCAGDYASAVLGMDSCFHGNRFSFYAAR
jgi:hypothetical protein